LFVSAGVIAKADPTYFTKGCFGLACAPQAVDSLAVGGGFLVFNGQLPFALNISPGGFSSAQLGDFRWLGNPFGIIPPTAFTLEVTQTSPVAGVGNFTVVVSGLVIFGQSNVNVVFSTTQVTLGSNTYTVTNLGGPGTINPNALLINPPGQLTSIQGIVTNPVPEPTTIIMALSGLLMLGSRRFLRRKN
jgi:hypothetical protein